MPNKTSEQRKEHLVAQRKRAAVKRSKRNQRATQKAPRSSKKASSCQNVQRKCVARKEDGAWDWAIRLNSSAKWAQEKSQEKELGLRPRGERGSLKSQSENQPMNSIAISRPTSIRIGKLFDKRWVQWNTEWAATNLMETEPLISNSSHTAGNISGA